MAGNILKLNITLQMAEKRASKSSFLKFNDDNLHVVFLRLVICAIFPRIPNVIVNLSFEKKKPKSRDMKHIAQDF